MKKNRVFKLFLGVSCLVALLMLPFLIAAIKHKVDVDRSFNELSNALISKNYEQAYNMTGDSFRSTTESATFTSYFSDFEKKFGKLISIERINDNISKSGVSSNWIARIESDLHFEKNDIEVLFEYHLENDKWVIFGMKQL